MRVYLEERTALDARAVERGGFALAIGDAVGAVAELLRSRPGPMRSGPGFLDVAGQIVPVGRPNMGPAPDLAPTARPMVFPAAAATPANYERDPERVREAVAAAGGPTDQLDSRFDELPRMFQRARTEEAARNHTARLKPTAVAGPAPGDQRT